MESLRGIYEKDLNRKETNHFYVIFPNFQNGPASVICDGLNKMSPHQKQKPTGNLFCTSRLLKKGTRLKWLQHMEAY